MNKIKYFSSLILAICLFSSCDLDRFPASAIEQSQSFESVSDVDQLLNGSYAIFRGGVYGEYLLRGEVQSDLFHATLDYGNRIGPFYTWTFDAREMTLVWQRYYNLIANLNNIINNADNVEVRDQAQAAELSQYKAEAYAMRAYAYLVLIQSYAKDYEPSSAATDLGVPIVLEYNVALRPARSTVAEVYSLIISDITEAKALMVRQGAPNSTKFNIDALSALEARVLLNMHDFTNAATVANSLINSGKYPLSANETEFRNLWFNDENPEIVMNLFTNDVEGVNVNSQYLGYVLAEDKYTPDFVPQQWVIDLYEDADIRKSVYFINPVVKMQSNDYTDVYLLNKYPFTQRFSTSGNYQHRPIIFRIAEMYLISAEAAAQNTSTEAAALSTLNVLRRFRGLNDLSGLTGTALMTAIQEERTRELVGEGFRLFDLKRWKMDMQRSDPQNISIVDGSSASLFKPANDNQFVWGIPTNDITTNPNLAGQQNPGW